MVAWLIALGSAHAAEDKLRLVRETDALTAQQEQTMLRAPPGFSVQLFASEPMINKPINMAFDARGRLWVSSTVEYPYAAAKDRWSDAQGSHVKGSRDAIKILEDTDGDGTADKVTDFADGLNIPTGVLPWHKPAHKGGCIAWSIPNIWYFADTDGDGKCDLREVLFGPLGYEKDTHGMCSSFRLGLDGWVYATHGFNNTSHLQVLPTHRQPGTRNQQPGTLDLHSGNVFRFRPDGSAVELYSAGQVNPFGLCWDRYGNLYSADCHSNPITQLIRGAHYPSFGKPHDGLGHAPNMCEHSHGSTGICGIIYIDGGIWGREWDDHMFLGNCVTSKVNHDRITFTGSTPKATEQPDFITSGDPWFRPVDLQLGPDNALYIADFYNKIIGHYEVPLDHPGRDKERGRIWRVVKKETAKLNSNFAAMNPEALAAELGNSNLTRRHLALREVKQRGTKEWVPAFLNLLDDDGKKIQPMGDHRPDNYPADDQLPQDAPQRGITTKANLSTAHALWACSYLGERYVPFAVNRGLLSRGAWLVDENDASEGNSEDTKFGLLMAHAAQVIGSNQELHPWEKFALHRIFDHNGDLALRAACTVLFNRSDYLKGGEIWRAFAVADVIRMCDEMSDANDPKADDPWLRPGNASSLHSLRVLIRDYLSQPGIIASLKAHNDETLAKPWFVNVMKAVPNADAASFLMARLGKGIEGDAATWNHIARYADETTLGTVITSARQQTKTSMPSQIDALEAIHNALLERGSKPTPSLLTWATDLADSLLAYDQSHASPWSHHSHPASSKSESPWCLQDRKCSDGKTISVISSLNSSLKAPEKLTGILRSQTFAAPDILSFWLCGHQGFPKTGANQKNLVRLIAAPSSPPITPLSPPQVLHQASPPRTDTCQRIEWDLTSIQGKPVRLEIIDSDDGTAYAWLGVGRFEQSVLSTETFSAADTRRKNLKTLAAILRTTAPVGLRDKLAAFLPQPATITQAKPQPEIDALIKQRISAFANARPDITKGEALFTTNCAVCHSLGGKGGLIGPQLDGIGHRGAERVIEDVLDTNRNVDAHFHLHQMKLRDGSSVTGFVRGEVGQVTILVDAAGNEQRISRGDIVQDIDMPRSLMPPTFGQTIPAAAFNDLIAWLLKR